MFDKRARFACSFDGVFYCRLRGDSTFGEAMLSFLWFVYLLKGIFFIIYLFGCVIVCLLGGQDK